MSTLQILLFNKAEIKKKEAISDLISHSVFKAFYYNPHQTYLANFKIQPLNIVTIKSLWNVMKSNLVPLKSSHSLKKHLQTRKCS